MRSTFSYLRMLIRTGITLLMALMPFGFASSQSNEQCSIVIKVPSSKDVVKRFGRLEGTALIPSSTELRVFRKRHDAKTWSPVLGTILCKASPCSWMKELDLGPDSRTLDIAVVAADKDHASSSVANLPRLPVGRGGCKAEVTVITK